MSVYVLQLFNIFLLFMLTCRPKITVKFWSIRLAAGSSLGTFPHLPLLNNNIIYDMQTELKISAIAK